MEPGDSNLARNDLLGAEKNGITAICREKCVELMARWGHKCGYGHVGGSWSQPLTPVLSLGGSLHDSSRLDSS
jgi:hypothetical protein